jgi:ketosteroid isomerase-like protein
MSYLHPDALIFESGHAEARGEYRAGHLEADIAFLQSVVSETTWEKLQIGTDLTLYMSEYRTHGTFRDREIDLHGTETIVLVQTETGWQILHIHWSHAS